MVSGDCECIAGHSRAPCSHKIAVAEYFNIAELCVVPDMDARSRGLYHYLATGTVVEDAFYRDLDTPDENINVAEFVNSRSQQHPQPPIDAPEVVDYIPEVDTANSDLDISHDNSDDGEMMLREYDDVVAEVRGTLSTNSSNKSLRKSSNYFVKQLRKSVRGNIQNLMQAFYSFGRQVSAASKSGRKRNSKLIPVQPTSINRRVAKHRGRGRTES